jgi:hypothetical protein
MTYEPFEKATCDADWSPARDLVLKLTSRRAILELTDEDAVS